MNCREIKKKRIAFKIWKIYNICAAAVQILEIILFRDDSFARHTRFDARVAD